MTDVLSKEQARKEVELWLDYKKVSTVKREANRDNIEKIIAGIMAGNLTLNPDTFVFEQTLNFPIGEEMKITKLNYKPRVSVDVFQNQCLGNNPEDGFARVFAFIAGLTGMSKHVIAKLDSDDYLLGSNIAVFFMA